MIDFSKPECSTCSYYRTSGIFNTHQESVDPNWFITEPVQSLGPKVTFGAPEDFGKTASQFGNGVARSDVGYVPNLSAPSTITSTVVFGTTPVLVSSVCNPKNPFGVIHLPGSSSDLFGSMQRNSIPGFGVKTTLPQPSRFSSSSSEFIVNPIIGGSSYQGNKGVFAPAYISPTVSRPNTAQPWIFAPESTPDNPQNVTFERREETFTGFATTLFPSSSSSSPISTTVPAASSSVIKRPNETIVGSSGCCTACGAATTITSSSASGYSTFNGVDPSPVATSLSTSGSSSAGTTNLAAQGTIPRLEAFDTKQGTTPAMFATNLAAQGTSTLAFQAYPTMFDWDVLIFRLSTFIFLLVCLLVIVKLIGA